MRHRKEFDKRRRSVEMKRSSFKSAAAKSPTSKAPSPESHQLPLVGFGIPICYAAAVTSPTFHLHPKSTLDCIVSLEREFRTNDSQAINAHSEPDDLLRVRNLCNCPGSLRQCLRNNH